MRERTVLLPLLVLPALAIGFKTTGDEDLVLAKGITLDIADMIGKDNSFCVPFVSLRFPSGVRGSTIGLRFGALL